MTGAVLANAMAVLDANRRDGWTCPAQGIYPHQWLWDSSFVAIGLARHDPPRAASEITSLFRGQWSNGMLPHMIFAPDVPDVGSQRLWQSRRDPRAPDGVDTSCITQPPVVAIAARRVADALDTMAREAFVAEVFPGLVAHHEWLYRERDPGGTGLVSLIHPWECGLDTTPPWMIAMRGVRSSAWVRIAMATRLTRLVRRLRRDTQFIPAAERASDDDGLRMLDLARRARRHHFDLAAMPPDESLVVQDVSFNALLVVANRDLQHLAERAGVDLPTDLRARMATTPPALQTLWDEASSMYCSRDTNTGKLLEPATIASFVMLWAGCRADRTERLVGHLATPAWQPAHPVPSIAADNPHFEPRRYWSGPTWVNMNWIVIQGLRAVGEHAAAEELRRSTLNLVEQFGFAEYFSPLTGEPLGAPQFSWTAALAVDLTVDLATEPDPPSDR